MKIKLKVSDSFSGDLTINSYKHALSAGNAFFIDEEDFQKQDIQLCLEKGFIYLDKEFEDFNKKSSNSNKVLIKNNTKKDITLPCINGVLHRGHSQWINHSDLENSLIQTCLEKEILVIENKSEKPKSEDLKKDISIKNKNNIKIKSLDEIEEDQNNNLEKNYTEDEYGDPVLKIPDTNNKISSWDMESNELLNSENSYAKTLKQNNSKELTQKEIYNETEDNETENNKLTATGEAKVMPSTNKLAKSVSKKKTTKKKSKTKKKSSKSKKSKSKKKSTKKKSGIKPIGKERKEPSSMEEAYELLKRSNMLQKDESISFVDQEQNEERKKNNPILKKHIDQNEEVQ